MNILIDNVDVSADALKGLGSPTVGVVFPAENTWIDLLPAILNNSTLRDSFFKPGIHTIKIVSSTSSQSAKIFLKSKYSTRNR